MTLEWRKLVLEVCQVGYEEFPESFIDAVLDLSRSGLPSTNTDSLHVSTFLDLMSHIAMSVILRSFISMCVRSFGFNIDGGSEEAIRAGLWKEINAGRNVFRDGQYGGYGVFNDGPSTSIPDQPNTPRWIRQATGFVDRLAISLTRCGLIYPKVQRIKNVSRETCELLSEAGYDHRGREVYALTTLDLEKWYAQTGQKIGGRCEMRVAWRFNDLKPRIYYCQGGTMYWSSRYMRPIADIFMNSWPMTHKERRTYPDSVSRFMSPDDSVLYWDMTSFTTQLSELKYFLFWIARALENNLYLRQHPIKVFDYREGVKAVNVWDLLDEYNDVVNDHGEYSLERVAHLAGIREDLIPIVQMMNSGPLGVLGNIGFSTTEHSVHCGVIVDQNKGVGLGDDHLVMVERKEEEKVINHMSAIGVAHRGKMGILRSIDETDAPKIGKFVKRGLRRYQDYWQLDILFNFPILAYAWGIGVEDRTVSLDDRSMNAHRFASQVAAFFWSLCDLGHLISTPEMKLVRIILTEAYKKLGWNWRGSLPGKKVSGSDEMMRLCVPPLMSEEFDPREEDWAEYLWSESLGSYVSLPVRGDPRVRPEPFYANEVFVAGQTRFIMAMLDMGFIKKLKGHTEVVEVSEPNRRLFRKWLHAVGPVLCDFVCVKDIPFHLVLNFATYRLLCVQSESMNGGIAT